MDHFLFLNGSKVSERQIQVVLYVMEVSIISSHSFGSNYTTKMYEIYCIERGANIYEIVVLVPE